VKKYLPFSLTAAIILVDQVTKALVVRFIPPYHIGASFLGGFFRIIHVRNHGIAFSMGVGLAPSARAIFFSLLPIVVLVLLLVYYIRSRALTVLQRWAIAGILGGGLGNLTDRVFRPLGVVDFLDFRFYGIFGLERWPTFNVADSSVVVCGIILVLTFLFDEWRKHE
jgi:signal peptidase II